MLETCNKATFCYKLKPKRGFILCCELMKSLGILWNVASSKQVVVYGPLAIFSDLAACVICLKKFHTSF